MRNYLFIFVLIACLCGCEQKSSESPAQTTVVAPILTTPAAPIVATHYFGRHWAKTFITSFHREDLAGDFQRIKDDGFNTVIFVLSWGDFQPNMTPCCGYDQRAFDRLHILLAEAQKTGLSVMFRIGFGVSFHPDSGATAARYASLFNSIPAREAFMQFVSKVAEETKHYSHISMSFLSWEDIWLREVSEVGEQEFREWHSQNYPNEPMPQLPLRANSEHAKLFNTWWDHVVLNKFYIPASLRIPNLSLEARVDKEPRFELDSAGNKQVVEWLDHRAMYQMQGNVPLTIYWAPFWGAKNIGEQLSHQQSLKYMHALLQETLMWSGNRPLFINQFNFVDNTPGYESNAVIAEAEIAPFLRQALCTMKSNSVIGYGVWTYQDYMESPIANPSFAYGLEHWSVKADGVAAESLLHKLPSGDLGLQLEKGQVLIQAIDKGRGRLPMPDERADQICVRAQSEVASSIEVRINQGKIAKLSFSSGPASMQCSAIESVPKDDLLDLQLGISKGSVLIRDVWLSDHIQYGGLRDINGNDGPHLKHLQALNRQFYLHELPEYCRAQ